MRRIGGCSSVDIAELWHQPCCTQAAEDSYVPLLPTSKIGSLFCADVSRTPPIELIELVVDPRRLAGWELGYAFWGEADGSTFSLALGRDISIP